MHTIGRRIGLILSLAAALLGRAAVAADAAATHAAHVFIVSYDGGKPAVMTNSPMPLTLSMAQRGAATWSARTIFPCITLVAHTSMLTGVVPAKHHITWNDWVPTNGLVTVPTVFQLAKEAGHSTALFAGKIKFRHLGLTNTLDTLVIEPHGALAVASNAAAYIVANKPDLCFVHFADSDVAGHAHGWGSPEQIQSFADEDSALQILWNGITAAGIAADSTLILTADHGGHGKGHGQNIPDDMDIPWIAFGCRVKSAYAIADPVSTCDTAATALWLLGVAVPSDWDGKPVLSAFEP